MPANHTPPAQELKAPESWRTVDIMSDLHLQEGLDHVQAWADYLACSSTDALLILGDLFEVWVGDDAADACGAVAHFEQHGLQLLQQASRRFPIWVMHGNRDFLLGNRAARLGGFDFMADPCVLTFGGARWLLTHGDALCLEDSAYQSFRQLVRSPQWQHDFLALPLSERKQQVRQMRAQSRLHQARLKQQQQAGSAGLSDVSTPLALQWMNDLSTPVMIHGHTHQPADHAMGLNRQRMVLSDWDGKATPFRAELIRLELQNTAPFGVQVSRVRCAPLA